jgi:hypothetical protein
MQRKSVDLAQACPNFLAVQVISQPSADGFISRQIAQAKLRVALVVCDRRLYRLLATGHGSRPAILKNVWPVLHPRSEEQVSARDYSSELSAKTPIATSFSFRFPYS